VDNLKLESAGSCIEYSIEDPELAAFIGAEMGEFLSDRSPVLAITITPMGPIEGKVYKPLRIFDQGTAVHIERHDQTCRIDLGGGSGTALMASSTFAFGTFLRGLYSRLLLDYHGFILHASAMIRKGQAYVCTGPSGTGKTTISLLSPDNFLLTDELVILRQTEEGQVLACGTPFIGDSLVTGFNKQVPLHRLFHLVKARENGIKPLSLNSAVNRILGQVMFFDRSPKNMTQLLHVLNDLLGGLKSYELRFFPDPSIWELIDQMD